MMTYFNHKGIRYCVLTGDQDTYSYFVIVRSKYLTEYIYEGEQLGYIG